MLENNLTIRGSEEHAYRRNAEYCNELMKCLREFLLYRLLPLAFRPLGNLYPYLTSQILFPISIRQEPSLQSHMFYPAFCFYQVCPIHLKDVPFSSLPVEIVQSKPSIKISHYQPRFHHVPLLWAYIILIVHIIQFIPLLYYKPSLSPSSCINLPLPAGLFLLAHNYYLLIFQKVLKATYSPKY